VTSPREPSVESRRPLEGRAAWVTGAGRGLGRAIALGFAAAGATVGLTARSANELTIVQEEIAAAGGLSVVLPGSVCDPSAMREAVDSICSKFGRLDSLTNCAGVSPVFTRAHELKLTEWRNILEVNLTGTFICCQVAARVMIPARGGSIINLSSVHGTSGFGRLAAYSASKGGIEALTRALAVEWAELGLRVNCLAPGYFSTQLSKSLLASSWRDRVMSSIPLKRVGEPKELVEAAIFLAGNGSSYVTGTTLFVDGGWTAR
jgi:NAD(P)-dependent dehydrogenase (short-subunit alcohol dehydrogenase family)